MNRAEEIIAVIWWSIAFFGCIYLAYSKYDVPLTKEQIDTAVMMLFL